MSAGKNFLKSLVPVFVAGLLSTTATASNKPFGYEELSESVGKCRQLSESSKKKNINVLVIGFEGLGSFNAELTARAYQFQSALARKQNPEPPMGGNGYVVNRVVIPFMRQFPTSVEFLMFPETSINSQVENSVPEACAAEWMKGGSNRKLVIIGHSYGGHAANQLAEALEERRIAIEAVVTFDARTKYFVGHLRKTKNTKWWGNFYQQGMLSGYVVPGADVNKNLSQEGVSHGTIVMSKTAQNALAARLRKAVADSRAAANAKKTEEAKKVEEARKAAEAKRAEEARKVAEAKRAEEARQAALVKQQQEEARKAAEAKRAEEARKVAEAKRAEEARQAALVKQQQEEARKAAEAKRAEEARKVAEAKRAEEARKAALAKQQADEEAARRMVADQEARRAAEAQADQQALENQQRGQVIAQNETKTEEAQPEAPKRGWFRRLFGL